MPSSTNAEKYLDQSRVVSFLVRRFLHALAREAGQVPVQNIVDLGCGEGFVAADLLRLLPAPVRYFGIDSRARAIVEARQRAPQADFKNADLLVEPPRRDWADLLVMIEVLEHLPEPAPALDVIAAWNPKRAIITVPWEPFFRAGNVARGKWLSRLGNHPEHVQQFTPASLGKLLRARFGENAVQVRTCFPWLMATVQLRGARA